MPNSDLDLERIKHEYAQLLTKARRDKTKHKQSPNYFVPANVIAKVVGVPGVNGINIYIGDDGGKDILILVPTTFNGKSTEDILSYSYEINGIAQKTIESPVYKSKGPHPPPPNTLNKINSDE